MRIYWATFFVGDLVIVRQLQSETEEKARGLAERFAKSAAVATEDAYQFLHVYDNYPSEYVITEAQVSDLEFLSKRMRKEKS